MKKLNEITIADLMPDSISRDAEVSATSRAIDPQLKAISEAVNKPLILASIDELSEGVLEHLAVQYDVTAWNSAWDIDTKRAVLKTAIADKRKMGTRGAVQRAIEAVAPIATITEWWQDTSGDMPPHTFEIDLLQEGSAVDAETQASVIAQVNEVKPVRSHFTFSVGQMLGGNVYFAGVLRSIAYARVRSAGITIEQTNIQAGVLATVRGMAIRRFLAETEMGEMPEPEALIRGGLIAEDYDYEIRDALDALALMVPGGYAYQDGDLLDMQWDFGGVVEEYSPVVSLPTVSSTGDFGDNWVYANASFAVQSISPDSGSRAKYNWRGYANDITYDDSKSYAVIQWQETDGARAGAIEFSMEKASNYLFIKNISSQTLNFLKAHIAVCSSNQATVINVYNSLNVAYNAFKYSTNGSDYYYVLDGTQTDWTDDLESIGYYLGPTVTLYMRSGNKAIDDDFTNNTGVSGGYHVYADSAVTTPYYWDYTKRYERGRYNSETGKWTASSVQTQADMPLTTGAAVYLTMPVFADQIYFAKNNSGSSYYTMTELTNYFRVYDDAITVWVNQDHTDHTVTGTQTYISDVDWDDSVTYKVLYFLQVYGVTTNPTGSSVATYRLQYVSFENSGGKVAVKLTLGNISIHIAKIVFYAKKAST